MRKMNKKMKMQTMMLMRRNTRKKSKMTRKMRTGSENVLAKYCRLSHSLLLSSSSLTSMAPSRHTASTSSLVKYQEYEEQKDVVKPANHSEKKGVLGEEQVEAGGSVDGVVAEDADEKPVEEAEVSMKRNSTHPPMYNS